MKCLITKKEVSFEWTEKCEGNIQKLKTLLKTTPTLALPMGTKDFIVYCDASHSRFEVVLMQDMNVISYTSHKLKVHERYYPTPNLEFIAIVISLKILRHYVYGVKSQVFIDNHSSQHIFT